jgi:hypothetical protein
MCYSFWYMSESYLGMVLLIFLSEFFQIFGLLLLLVLDDGGCLNSLFSFLPMDLFLSTSAHLSLGHGSRVIFSTLGLAVISGKFPRY